MGPSAVTRKRRRGAIRTHLAHLNLLRFYPCRLQQDQRIPAQIKPRTQRLPGFWRLNFRCQQRPRLLKRPRRISIPPQMPLARLQLRHKLATHLITTRLDRRPDRNPQLVQRHSLGGKPLHGIGDDPALHAPSSRRESPRRDSPLSEAISSGRQSAVITAIGCASRLKTPSASTVLGVSCGCHSMVVALCTCLQMNTSSGRNGSSIVQNPWSTPARAPRLFALCTRSSPVSQFNPPALRLHGVDQPRRPTTPCPAHRAPGRSPGRRWSCRFRSGRGPCP